MLDEQTGTHAKRKRLTARRRGGRGHLGPLVGDPPPGRSPAAIPPPARARRRPFPFPPSAAARALCRGQLQGARQRGAARAARTPASVMTCGAPKQRKQRSGWDVTLYESEKTFGGHTLTDETIPGVPVDLGFQVRARVCGRARFARRPRPPPPAPAPPLPPPAQARNYRGTHSCAGILCLWRLHACKEARSMHAQHDATRERAACRRSSTARRMATLNSFSRCLGSTARRAI